MTPHVALNVRAVHRILRKESRATLI